MKRNRFAIGLTLGLGLLLISCGGGNKAAGAGAKALLSQVAPSEEEVLQIISGEAAKKAEAASINPQQALPPDTIQFDLVNVDMWAEHGGVRLSDGAVPAEGDLGFILYNFYYLDTAPNPDVELEGKITFDFVYQGNEFVAADPSFAIEFVTVTATIQGDVVNAVIDALTPGVRDGFIQKVAVTAIADDGSVTRTDTTDASGIYQIKVFGGGRTFAVKAFQNGYLEGVKTAAIAVTETVTMDFDLLPALDSEDSYVENISGTVTDLDNHPVAGAIVYLVDSTTYETVPGVDSCLTNASGDYMIVAVPYGSYIFVANKGSKSGTTGPVTIPVSPADVDIQIQDHAPDCTSVTSNPVSPVNPGNSVIITVQANDSDGDVLYYDFISSAGSFLLPGGGTLNTATWLAPVTNGIYTIDVVVSDGGLEDTCSITIQDMSWREVGGSATGGGISQSTHGIYPIPAFDSAGNVYVVWSDDGEVMVKMFDTGLNCWIGPSQVKVAGNCGIADNVSNTPGQDSSNSMFINFDNFNIPYVIWRENVSGIGTCTYLRKFNSSLSQWDEVGGSASGTGLGQGEAEDFVFDSNNDLFVSYQAGNIYVKVFDSSAGTWGGLAGSDITPIGSSGDNPTYISMDDVGRPYVSWSSVNGDAIYLTRFNGTAWEDVGTGSSSGSGITGRTGFNTQGVALADKNTGKVSVIWNDQSTGTWQIYFKTFDSNTSSWVDQPNGSSTGVGISNVSSPNQARGTIFGFDVNGFEWASWTYIDSQTGGMYIYAKKYDGSNWVEADGSASGTGIDHGAGLYPWIPVIFVYNDYLAGNSIPYVTWTEVIGSNDSEAYLKRYWYN